MVSKSSEWLGKQSYQHGAFLLLWRSRDAHHLSHTYLHYQLSGALPARKCHWPKQNQLCISPSSWYLKTNLTSTWFLKEVQELMLAVVQHPKLVDNLPKQKSKWEFSWMKSGHKEKILVWYKFDTPSVALWYVEPNKNYILLLLLLLLSKIKLIKFSLTTTMASKHTHIFIRCIYVTQKRLSPFLFSIKMVTMGHIRKQINANFKFDSVFLQNIIFYLFSVSEELNKCFSELFPENILL